MDNGWVRGQRPILKDCLLRVSQHGFPRRQGDFLGAKALLGLCAPGRPLAGLHTYTLHLSPLSSPWRHTPEHFRKCGNFYFYLFNLFIYLIYFWLRWVFVAVRRLSLVVASGGYSSLQCVGFSLQWLLLLRSTGSRSVGFSSCGTWASVVAARGLYSAGSVVVAHGLSCSAACGIFPDQGSNPCPLHWQADS